jgi:DNA-binding transcriptional ArsR family regulator
MYTPKLSCEELRKRKQRLNHYHFPASELEALTQKVGCSALAVLLTIYEVWYKDYQRNPIKLTNVRLKEKGISRSAKGRALDVLEKAGLIAVERRPRKSPIVTIKWKALRK